MKLGIINLIVCFVLAVVIAPIIIKWLYRLKFGQSILVYVEKHKQKSGTATMGGLIFLIVSIAGYLIFCRGNRTLATIALLSMIFFGVIGFLDDFIKIKYRHNEGLKPYQKIIGQFSIAIIIAIFVYNSDLVGSECYIPFTDRTIDLGWWIIPFVIVVYLAIVNSVNLIDGLDGLCGSVSSVVMIAIGVIVCLMSSRFDGVYLVEINNLVVLLMGVVGAVLGFLCYNVFPAKVFMGDTGSLALGGLIASVTTFSKNYFLIMIVGIMFVLTALSVILQVGYFKLTKKRIFKMAPLHHHFEQDHHEVKVVSIYVIVTIIIGLLSITMYL